MLLLEIVYLISATLLAVYGLNSLLHTWLFVKKGRNRPSRALFDADDLASRELPTVTVQLPIYNERYVVNRLISAVLELSWPRDRLQVQILDDSTDETSQIVANTLGRLNQPGFQIEHIQRRERKDFKAGALQVGLETAVGEFIVIFDADFVPPSDFLLKTIPLFDSEEGEGPIGCVQARWGHTNANMSLLTKAQSLGIDGHFVVEQAARDSVGAFMNFNGTAGIWRRRCMDAVGGWQGDTLTEDLDLSYRAQLAGWRVVYQPEVVVPAELPVQLAGFKRQQFRWAKGSIQTAMKLLGRVWRSETALWRKLLGTLHLTNYAIHPLMVINLLLTLPMSISDSPFLHLAPIFMLSAVGPPMMYWVAMNECSKNDPLTSRLIRLLMLVILGMGLSVNNTRAVAEALSGRRSDFKRTPKFAVTNKETAWYGSSYTLPKDSAIWGEGVLLIFALFLTVWSIYHGMLFLIGWLLLYAAGYAMMIGLALIQARHSAGQTVGVWTPPEAVESGD